MNIIVAVNNDWGIGFKGTQQIVIPEDRRHFAEITRGGIVIAGRKTFNDCGGPLPGRKNILLTHDKDFICEGFVVVNSLEQTLDALADEDRTGAFVIGGGEIYMLFLPICEYAYVTKINISPISDTFFPNLDEMSCWSLERITGTGEHYIETNERENSINYTFSVYKNNAIAEHG